RARGHADAGDLGAEEEQVEERERACEARLRRERLVARLAERLVTDRGVERDDPPDDCEARRRPAERSDERDEDVRRGREAAGQRAVEAEEQSIETDGEERAELEV